jgi:AcrR family transcriptional regulator
MRQTATPREGKAAKSRVRIIAAAAGLFAEHGFEGTSIRDIAGAASMTTAALYYHFESKEAIYVAVHGYCMDAVSAAVERAVTGLEDPWKRLEMAAGAHCAALLESNGNGAILSNLSCLRMASVREAVIAQRDAYDRRLQRLIDDLPLPGHVDRKLLRLQLLGSWNFMPNWYRKGGRRSAQAIGRTTVRLLRDGLGPAHRAPPNLRARNGTARITAGPAAAGPVRSRATD